MDRFTAEVVIITGGNSGIGRASARRLAAERAAVVLAARRKDLGETVVAEIQAAGGQALFVPTDITHGHAVAQLVATAVASHGGWTARSTMPASRRYRGGTGPGRAQVAFRRMPAEPGTGS